MSSDARMFTQKVDPLVKMLRMESVENVTKQAVNDLEPISNNQCFAFAIYLTVISKHLTLTLALSIY